MIAQSNTSVWVLTAFLGIGPEIENLA